MIIPHRLLAVATSILVLAGCAAPPKPVSHEVPTKRPYWEYTYLYGYGSDKSLEADKLRQAGWVFVGYNVSHGDTIAIDEKSEAAQQMAIVRRINHATVPQDVMRATFRRECK